MSNVPHKRNDEEDVQGGMQNDIAESELLLEEDEEVGVSLKNKLTSIRNELAQARKERDENLAGWQRAKADLVNYRRLILEDQERDKARAKGAILRAIIPALDSFEGAIAADTWKTVSEVWRNGVERIHAQFINALATEGLTTFGEVGEPFNPVHHECMSVTATTDTEKDHTVAQVLQKGYRIGTEVVRPAKIVVAQLSDSH